MSVLFGRKDVRKQMRYYAVSLKGKKQPEYVKADDLRRRGTGLNAAEDYVFLNGTQVVATYPGDAVEGVNSTRFQAD